MVPIAEHWDAEKHWSQDATDAIRAMRDLVDVLEWYVVHYDPSCRLEETPAGTVVSAALLYVSDSEPTQMSPTELDAAVDRVIGTFQRLRAGVPLSEHNREIAKKMRLLRRQREEGAVSLPVAWRRLAERSAARGSQVPPAQ